MTQRTPSPFGDGLPKVDPKLRMIANGNDIVNTLRAERSSQVAVQSQTLLEEVPNLRTPQSTPSRFDERRMARGHLKGQLPKEALVNVFVTGTGDTPGGRLPGRTSRRGNIVMARSVPVKELTKVMGAPGARSVELADALVRPEPVWSAPVGTAPGPSERRIGLRNIHKDGEGVLIGIIDVGGFEFSHQDFLDSNGDTRWVAIWDQGGRVRPRPPGFDDGSEITAAHMNRALQAASSAGVPAWQLEPQSQMSEGSHGTHVASIAAGNRGVCRQAKLAGVLVSLPPEDQDRRKSFYDSTRIVEGVEYLLGLGQRLRLPVSINISLGTNGHAHDGSAAVSRWIDAALTEPGRCVCVAAGNAGQEAPSHPDDIGWTMGRIHTKGRIPAAGLDQDIEWTVVGDTIADLSENELEIWYGAQDRFAVSLRPPGQGWTERVGPCEFIENRRLTGGTFISIYNELYHPVARSNYIAIYLSPTLTENGVTGVAAGTWLVRLHGISVRDGEYHAWIERDDPQPLGGSDGPSAWAFPSFLSQRSFVDESSVSSLACGHNVIGVANFEASANRINVTSSQGPTRDGRSKPEIAAPGTDIVAANAFSDGRTPWRTMTGTSMASPYVAGVAGLMLSADRDLTASQIGGIIQRTARPLPGFDFAWRNDAGFGNIDPEECIRETANVRRRRDLT